jgi:hypothetical protein
MEVGVTWDLVFSHQSDLLFFSALGLERGNGVNGMDGVTDI